MSTPTPPNDPPAAGEMLPGEAELAALYRRLPRREPGPALDAAVRHAAAQALGTHQGPLHVERRKNLRESGDWVHPKPLSAISARAIPSVESAARTRHRHVPHWLVALGSAASLVLVAGLAWHMRSTPTATPLSAETAAPEQAAAARAAGEAADRALAAAPSARAPTPEAAAKRKSMAANKQAVAPAVVAEMAAPPPAPKPAPAAARMARARLQPQMTAASPALSPSAEAVRLEASAPAPAAPPAPPQADIAAQAAAPAAATSVATPADELARIEQLFAQGAEHEAQQRLLDFHRAHPQWPLPPELQAKLPRP
jgi:hypothetical protein